MRAAVQVLESREAGVPIKVSAVKAIHKSVEVSSRVRWNLTHHLSFCNGGEDSAIRPFAARIAEDLGPFLLSTSDDTLSLVLETLAVILEVDEGKWLTGDLAALLVNTALEVWSKNNKGNISPIKVRLES